MAWQDEMVIILRHMIDDVGDTPTYSDSRLEELILSCALKVKVDVGNFKQVYSFNIQEITLTPDPTAEATRDDDFIALVTLKAACIIGISELKAAAGKGIRIKEGRTELDFTGTARTRETLVEGKNSYCNMYKDALDNFRINGAGGVGKAILGPFAGESTQFLTRYYSAVDYYRNYRR